MKVYDEYEVIENIMDMIWYNHDKEVLIELRELIKDRFVNPTLETTADIIDLYTILVLRYGEYGTTPSSGWILEEYKEALIQKINEFLQENQEW